MNARLAIVLLLVLVAIVGVAVWQIREDDTSVSAPFDPDCESQFFVSCYEGTGWVFLGPKKTAVGGVTDGDTIRMADGRRVRLVQIDAPETGECYEREATSALSKLVAPGSKVGLLDDVSLEGRDEYGRLLRYVITADGVIVNEALVRRGAAVPYFFRGKRGDHAAELLKAAKEARRNRRGLWGACLGAKLDPNRGSLTGPA